MAEPTVTYADFTGLFGEVATEDGFTACLPHATALVRDLAWPNVPATGAQEDAWTRAVCAAVAADAATGCGHGLDDSLGGFSIGSFSVSGGSSSGSEGGTAAAMRDAAYRQLVGSGLLYMGLGELR